MQPVAWRSAIHIAHDEHLTPNEIDHGRALDADSGRTVGAAERRRDRRSQLTMHQHSPGAGVDRVDAVALRHHVDDVVPASGNIYRGTSRG